MTGAKQLPAVATLFRVEVEERRWKTSEALGRTSSERGRYDLGGRMAREGQKWVRRELL